MPEERLALAGDPPSSRDATVLEEWRTYLWHLAWQRGRHGRGRTQRRMTALEIARSVSRISVARGVCQRPRGRGQGITEVSRPEEGGVNLLEMPVNGNTTAGNALLRMLFKGKVLTEDAPRPSPLSPDASGFIFDRDGWHGIGPLKRKMEENLTRSSVGSVAVKRPRLGDRASQVAEDGRELVAKNVSVKQTSDSSDCAEDPTKMDVPMAMEESTCALAKEGVEEPGEIAKELITAECLMEEPVARKNCAEIASTQRGVEVTVAGEISADESRLAEGGLEKPMVVKTEAEITLSKRWLPLPYPAFPKTHNLEDFIKYTNESKRIREHNNQGFDRCKNLPYFALKPDKESSAAVKKSTKKRDICQKAGLSVVAVSSVGPGQDNDDVHVYFSGVITDCPEGGVGLVKILTSSGVLYDNDGKLRSPDQKIYVKLVNDQKYEGSVSFVNKHYEIALLEVSVDSSGPPISFGSMPQNGQKVTTLGRDSKSLFLRNGCISTMEQASSGRTHYMFLENTSENKIPLIAAGGPVIDEDGAMVSIITCHVPQAAMLPIPIVQSCLDMWKNYSCIARPKISMNLRTVNNLSIDIRDKMQGVYGIRSGFIVDGVEFDSAPEKVGIRKGDVIEILDAGCGSTLPELETYLLSHGLKFLSEMKAGLTELELKIRVHDLIDRLSIDTRVSFPLVYELRLG